MAKEVKKNPEIRLIDSYQILKNCIKKFLPDITDKQPTMTSEEIAKVSQAITEFDIALSMLELGNWRWTADKRDRIRKDIEYLMIGDETRSGFIQRRKNDIKDLDKHIETNKQLEEEEKKKELFFSNLEKMISDNKDKIYETLKGLL